MNLCGYLSLSDAFLMHRVELKVLFIPSGTLPKGSMFLMHRVELKGFYNFCEYILRLYVPNAPCGVESVELKVGRS
jgi:hypothetical protein